MNTEQWREGLREHARQSMRREIQSRRAAGVALFTDHQVGVLHQQIRDQRAKAS